MRILEGANFEGWESVEIENFLEIANLIVGNVQFFQRDQPIQSHPYYLDLVA
jgi:hypothetical protein